jgi:hypothetical protein
MLLYWTTLTKLFYIPKYQFNTKKDIKKAMRYHGDSLWSLHNIPSAENNQKLELTVQLHEQMICCDNLLMKDSL